MDPLVKIAKLPKNRREDSFVDRLSSRYTSSILVIFAVVVSITYWVRNPIVCWFPKFITKYQRRYGHGYCWVTNTYYLPYSTPVPRAHEEDRHYVRYYQWIPWILLTQAFLFWLPGVIWKQLSTKSGMDTPDIMAAAQALRSTRQMDRREERLERLAKVMHRFFRSRQQRRPGCPGCCSDACLCLTCRCSGRRTGAYLISVYIISKLLYLLNIFFQMFSLNVLLQTHFQSYPQEYFNFYHQHRHNVTQNNANDYLNSPVFPRITMCDMMVRVVGNTQRHTVQCVLSLNFYVEKMYLFLWFWFMFLLIATSIDFLLWFFRAVVPKDRINFVKNNLKSFGLIASGSEKDSLLLRDFVRGYLRSDGVFLLRLVAHNTTGVTASDMTAALWAVWQDERPLVEDKGVEAEDSVAVELHPLAEQPGTDVLNENLPAGKIHTENTMPHLRTRPSLVRQQIV